MPSTLHDKSQSRNLTSNINDLFAVPSPLSVILPFLSLIMSKPTVTSVSMFKTTHDFLGFEFESSLGFLEVSFSGSVYGSVFFKLLQ